MADPFDMAGDEGGWPWPAVSPGRPPDDLAGPFARCFSGPDGARVLAALKAMTLERALGPGVPDAALRHLEGQRHLVATILALVARGGGTPRSPRS